ncbi:short-chain dehydrogenase [Trichoderma harzianum]|uniref:Short-chain dehydrogenase n=1 Tax=Trichoderma harzianum TaxID=5544 RepID=A0A0G0AR91_TRIHA|nr:short-chain dehydrogenase [Trichoderma harzianum]
MGNTQEPELPIQLDLGPAIRQFFYSQFFITPRYPTDSFAGKTVIVTGSNVGLGLEAARHFYRLNAAKLILAVRTVSKGQAAKEDILRSVTARSDADAIEVWPLDQTSNRSTLEFCERVQKELPRLDAAVLNAGINTKEFRMVDGYEQVTQVNVLNTFLLALSLLPKLRDTKAGFPDTTPHLTIVSSEAHRLSKFDEINAANLYDQLNNELSYNQQPRYQVTKLLEILLVREIVARLKHNSNYTSHNITINLVNPGLCYSAINRSGVKPPLLVRLAYKMLARTTEVGGRCLVLAACAPDNSHGECQSDGKNQDVAPWIYTSLGQKAQKKAWEQTAVILEERKPGILKAAGL